MLNPDIDFDKYGAVLLDMNGTFVLDFDNFDRDQNFGRTYRESYSHLTAGRAHSAVRRAYDHLAARYVDPAFYARFPSVASALRATAPGQFPDAVIDELVDTFAQHEMGRLPTGYRRALTQLSGQRPLAVLSNLWAPPDRWYTAFEAWGIRQLFAHLSFSSQGPDIKPHADFFLRALGALGLPAKRVLYVGDSYDRDVVGAHGVGMDAVWLTAKPDARADGLQVGTATDLPSFVREVCA